MATIEQVVNALRAEMPAINVEALAQRQANRIYGIVVDQAFADLDHPDRQEVIWSALKKQIPVAELSLVGPISALSPEEAELRSADVA